MLPGNFVRLMNEPLRIGGSRRHQNAINWALPGIGGCGDICISWPESAIRGNRCTGRHRQPGSPANRAGAVNRPEPRGPIGRNLFGHGACRWMHGLSL
jgi:hypothetical protein